MDNARGTQAGGGSFSGGGLPETFFESGNLLRLLAAVRGSSIPNDARTEIRDLVLEYSQLTAEPERAAAKTRIAAALAPYRDQFTPFLGDGNDTPSVVAPKTAPTRPAFGSARPRPSFGVAAQTPPAEPVRKIPISVVKEPAPRPAPQPPPKPASAPAPAPAPAARPQPAPPSVPEIAADAPPQTGGNPKERIAEIKHAINDRVGNPVNLIEKNKEVGQEYMAALLDAIKRTSSPMGGVDPAMARLEKAYTTVLEVLRTEATAPAPVKKPEPAPKPVVSKPMEKKPVAAVNHIPQPKPVAPAAPKVAPPPPKPAPAPAPAPRPQPAPAPASPRIQSLRDRLSAQPAPAPVPKPSTLPAPTVPGRGAPPDAPGVSRAVSADAALNDPEVTAGLTQLLSEWKLFRSSGMFGTGPSGINHPLYKRLAALPMAAVIAGRFEGSSPEIRQNIADYMNGWRYEQGIVHRMDEQFEGYLRRVIRHIIDKRPKKTEPEAK